MKLEIKKGDRYGRLTIIEEVVKRGKTQHGKTFKIKNLTEYNGIKYDQKKS